MCLSLAVARPEDVLSRGLHAGYEWITMHNGMGNRCGYVRVPRSHPWHGMRMEEADIACNVHGGVTFAEPDFVCGGDAADESWWIGFDCALGGDLADLNLPFASSEQREFLIRMRNLISGAFEHSVFGATVKTQAYVEQECRGLCEQAAEALKSQFARTTVCLG